MPIASFSTLPGRYSSGYELDACIRHHHAPRVSCKVKCGGFLHVRASLVCGEDYVFVVKPGVKNGLVALCLWSLIPRRCCVGVSVCTTVKYTTPMHNTAEVTQCCHLCSLLLLLCCLAASCSGNIIGLHGVFGLHR